MTKELQYHLLTDDGLANIELEEGKSIDASKDYWLEVLMKDRKEIGSLLDQFHFEPEIIEMLEDPQYSTRFQLLYNTIVVNLPVSSIKKFYHLEYCTFIIKGNFVISINKDDNDVFEELKKEFALNKISIKMTIDHLFYYLLSEILQDSLANVNTSRNIINSLADRLNLGSNDISIHEIVDCKQKVSQLANIIEDQYFILGFVPKMDWSEDSIQHRAEFQKVIDGFHFLENSMERQEKRINDIHVQYQLLLQEKGNKRLNTLTVIQAIFVPLTLIAGIYGMNFVNMPELKWPNGYFLVLIFMGLLAVLELLLFKRHGWFD